MDRVTSRTVWRLLASTPIITMKDFLRRTHSFALNQLSGMKLLSGRRPDVLLFDSAVAASDIAFMLGAGWDGCNGVVMPKCDEVFVNKIKN